MMNSYVWEKQLPKEWKDLGGETEYERGIRDGFNLCLKTIKHTPEATLKKEKIMNTLRPKWREAVNKWNITKVGRWVSSDELALILQAIADEERREAFADAVAIASHGLDVYDKKEPCSECKAEAERIYPDYLNAQKEEEL